MGTDTFRAGCWYKIKLKEQFSPLGDEYRAKEIDVLILANDDAGSSDILKVRVRGNARLHHLHAGLIDSARPLA